LKILSLLAASSLVLTLVADSAAQGGMPKPEASPDASVSQTVGLTDITIVYSRPGVKGREIWGGVVPYGQVWRAGANENTTITFSDDVTLAGQSLAAGTYGLHMIPREGDWTVIFSNNATSWGSYSYDESEDALRVDVTPAEGAFTEWLTFDVLPDEGGKGTITLSWADLQVPVPVDTNLTATILQHTRDEYLRGLARWNPQAWQEAAQFCLDNDVNHEEGLAWAESAVAFQKTFTNLSIQAQLLEKLGRGDEAKSLKAEAWMVATEEELGGMGQQLMARSQFPEAIDIFRLNVRNHPENWKAHDRLAEAYRQSGDNEKAIQSYSKALGLVSDAGSRQRIERQLKALESQEQQGS